MWLCAQRARCDARNTAFLLRAARALVTELVTVGGGGDRTPVSPQ